MEIHSAEKQATSINSAHHKMGTAVQLIAFLILLLTEVAFFAIADRIDSAGGYPLFDKELFCRIGAPVS